MRALIRYRNHIITTNLKKSFPNKTPQERQQIKKRFYRTLCNTLFESIQSLSLNKNQICERIVLQNKNMVDNELKKEQPVIFLISHCYNWEWLSLSISAQFKNPYYFVYHRISTSLFDKLFLNWRQKFGGKGVEMRNYAKFILNLSKQKQAYLTLVALDQSPPRVNSNSLSCQFLNQSTFFFENSIKLAIRQKASIFFSKMHKVSNGYYRCELIPLVSKESYEGGQIDSKALTKEYARLLEENIQDYPESWLWSHKRWKHHPNNYAK